MIKTIDDYLSNIQCNSIINMWDENCIIDINNDNVYHYLGMCLMPHLKKINEIIPEFIKCYFKKFRIQCVDENIQQIKIPHSHINGYSFVIFLNDNFEGGELIFDNLIVKPKMGTMVYFTGNEQHRVENCVGKRWTLVGFLHNNLFTNLQNSTYKNLI